MIQMNSIESHHPAKATRNPKQTRSMHTKEKILDAAWELFCEKGYYKTTTNEIAQRAQVSIGSLYSYFIDKDAVFFELLEQYHQKFMVPSNAVLNHPELFQKDCRVWLKDLMEYLIQIHNETKEFNRELNVVSYYHPEVAAILAQNKKQSTISTIEGFVANNRSESIQNSEAAATVIFDLISATVDRIVFGNNELDDALLLETTIDMICKFLSIQP
jgi:AcrR family transcriptional regulator